MNFNELKELIGLIDQSGLSSFQYQKDGLKLKIEKGSKTGIAVSEGQVHTVNTVEATAEAKQVPVAETPASVTAQPTSPKLEGKVVKSPLVGVYYASPTPTSAPYISVGQKVKAGDTLCIVEAMKVMNEITAEFDGEVLEICAENETLVEYGQPLVRIG